MQLPVCGGRILESSDILLVGTISGFSLEATAKKEMEFTEKIFFWEDRETEIDCLCR